MQRDTLHRLYCTYDTRARTREGTSGIDRSLFVEVSIELARVLQYYYHRVKKTRCLRIHTECCYSGDVRFSSSPSPLKQMLSDLGVSPASVSKQRAAWVFDGVVRNGLTGPGARNSQKEQQALRRNANVHGSRDEGGPLMEIGIGERGGQHSPYRRHPRGDRLCWSLFLEAMVSALVQTTSWLSIRLPLSPT